MTYDKNSFCAFNKRNGDKNTITYPFANGERVIIQRTYSNNGTSVFSEIRIDENGEKTVSVLHRAEMNDELGAARTNKKEFLEKLERIIPW